jgi:glyoxylase-like metal-dependent hydrolase (beta-lactamase superfamily II)
MNELPIHTLQVPNPFFEGRNRVYVILGDPVTLVDTGIATALAFEALALGLARLGLSPGSVGRVILTHKHIDHIGSAWRFQEASGAEILIHESELEAVAAVDPDGQHFRDLVAGRMREWSVPADIRERPAGSAGLKWEIASAAPRALVDGQRIAMGDEVLEVIHTPGHTVGSICLRYGRYLFSGDHVLPDISPNIGGGDMRHRGLLGRYLDSLERIAQVAGDAEQVLPGHGDPFTNLPERCRALTRHHHERLARVVAILQAKPDQTVYEIAGRLFGSLEDFHVVLGCAEAEAHLEYLVDRGRVVCDGQRYRLSAPATPSSGARNTPS